MVDVEIGLPKFRSLKGLNRALLQQEQSAPGLGRAVLGEGPIGASIAFVGEQPGDQEDIEGRPFVGPAGRVLDEAMQAAGIDRAASYVTNAVKRFHFVQRGKKRLHQRPTTAEVVRGRWWLAQELDFVAPKIIVALGATAILALAGKRLGVAEHRGPAQLMGRKGFITVHPSALLRIPGREERQRARRAFAADLKKVRALSGG